MSSPVLAILALYAITQIIAITYVCFANIYSDKFTGILQRGYVYGDSSCNTNCGKNNNCQTSCSETYYVRQVFLKGVDSTSTCTVQRPTEYFFQGDADNFVSRMILGTSRELYQTVYSHGTCIDSKIRNMYNTIAICFFVIPNFIPICAGLCILCIYLYKRFISTRSEQIPFATNT